MLVASARNDKGGWGDAVENEDGDSTNFDGGVFDGDGAAGVGGRRACEPRCGGQKRTVFHERGTATACGCGSGRHSHFDRGFVEGLLSRASGDGGERPQRAGYFECVCVDGAERSGWSDVDQPFAETGMGTPPVGNAGSYGSA